MADTIHNNIDNWYEYKKSYDIIFIYLDKLTNDILDSCDIIPETYSHMKWIFEKNTNVSLDIDIDKLMSKLIHCKNLDIHYELNSTEFTLPPNLVDYYERYQHNILKFPNTLKEYICGNAYIPNNLPLSLEKITIFADSLNETFYNIPSSVTELYIVVDTLDIDNILWPSALKKLYLRILRRYDKSIGILPYGLEYFEFHCENYEYDLVLPPTVITFVFISRSEYKYIDSLNALPDSIEYLKLDYNSCSNISRLPKSCKEFIYWFCPSHILEEYKSRYPDVNITSE